MSAVSLTPAPIEASHYPAILRNNAHFVHWLAPLDEVELVDLLTKADYAKQVANGEGVLIAYDGNGPYRHKNVDWLSERFDDYFYIDRIILGAPLQGRGLARHFYDDLVADARARGHCRIGCEVNTVPDNPGSHAFHLRYGFTPIGDVEYSSFGKTLRYYTLEI